MMGTYENWENPIIPIALNYRKTMEPLGNYEKHDIKEQGYWMLLGGSFQRFLL